MAQNSRCTSCPWRHTETDDDDDHFRMMGLSTRISKDLYEDLASTFATPFPLRRWSSYEDLATLLRWSFCINCVMSWSNQLQVCFWTVCWQVVCRCMFGMYKVFFERCLSNSRPSQTSKENNPCMVLPCKLMWLSWLPWFTTLCWVNRTDLETAPISTLWSIAQT